MSFDFLSELLLTGVTLSIGWRNVRSRPGIALAVAVIAAAAVLGAAVYAGDTEFKAAHDLLTDLAACAALPLLAASLQWTRSKLAIRLSIATLFLMIAGMIALILIRAIGWTFWGQVAPALSAMLIFYTALMTTISARQIAPITGATVLVLCFVLNLMQLNFYPMDGAQQLHVLLSIALLCLTAAKPGRSKT
jgi:hypothetical protein